MKIKNTLKSVFALLFVFNAYSTKAQDRATSISWTNIGPENLSGSIRAVLADAKRPGRIYAGTASGGIFYSTDSARTWKVLVDNLTSNNISCMAQSSDGTIYVGTGVSDTSTIKGAQLTLLGAGIYKSTDGATFTHLLSTAITDTGVVNDYWSNVNDIDFNPNDPNHIFVATRKGILVSKDGGNAWANPIKDDPATPTVREISDTTWMHGYDVACGKGGVVLATIRGRIFLSKDFGDNFVWLDTVFNDLPEYLEIVNTWTSYKSLVAVSDVDDNYMYAAVIKYDPGSLFTPNNGYLLNIYQTKDKGTTWKPIIFNAKVGTPQPVFDPLNNQGLSHGFLGVFKGEKEKIYFGAGSYHTWSNTDGWIERLMSYQGPFNGVSSEGDEFYWATDLGILKSFKGGYVPQAQVAYIDFGTLPYSKGISVPQTISVSSDGHGKVGFLTTVSGSFFINEFSTKNGVNSDAETASNIFVPTKTIDSIKTPEGTLKSIEMNLLLNASPYAELKRSTDDGGSWTNITEGSNLDSVGLSWQVPFKDNKAIIADISTYSEQNNVISYSEKWEENLLNTYKARTAQVIMGVSWDYKDIKANAGTSDTTNALGVYNFDKIYDYNDNKQKPGLYVTRNPLDLGKPTQWYRIASALKANTGCDKLPSNGTLVAVTATADQDIVYAAYVQGSPILSTFVYRISNLNEAFKHKDSVWHYIDPQYTTSTYGKTCITKCYKIGVFTNRIASSLAVDPNDQGNLIVTFGGYGYVDYVYRNNDADSCPKVTSGLGKFESLQNNTLDLGPVYTAISDLNQPGVVLLGTESGAKICDNAFTADPAALVWSTAGDLPAIPLVKLYQNTTPTRFSGQTGTIYAATYGRGIYKSTSLVGIKKDELENAIAKNQMLVYPNPSNGNETRLAFAAEANTKVNIVVTDVNGRTLSVGQVNVTSGKNAISIDTQELTSGTYFVTVRDGKSISFASKFSIIK